MKTQIKIELIQSAVIDGSVELAGALLDVDKKTGDELIAQGLATAVEAKSRTKPASKDIENG